MRQDVYRVAYDQANAELGEILSKFEQLRARKERIEKVVDVLKPLVGSEMQSAPAETLTGFAQPEAPMAPPMEPQHMVAVPEPMSAPTPAPAAAPAPMRRSDSAFAGSTPSRDVREYSRLFTNGQTR
ncbi:MAG TPA: hypothetical protein VFU55_02505 [Terracidiphilus sp.]|nr:hypothetical protein [Terracidiphilus sp.]